MSCGKISTGYMLGAVNSGNDNSSLSTPGRVVLFSPESSQEDVSSPSFGVEPGQAIFVEAYNMPEGYSIYVNRLVRASYAPPHASPCPPCNMGKFPGPGGIIMYRERMTLGDGSNWWRLYKSSVPNDTGFDDRSVLQLLITIPGLYELELSSVDMLGDLQVEYITWNLGLTPNLPSVYYAGVANIYGV